MRYKVGILLALLGIAVFWVRVANNPNIISIDLDIGAVIVPNTSTTPDDPAETNPGRFVVLGYRREITFTSAAEQADAKVRLSWDTGKIQIESTPGAAVTPSGSYGDGNAYKDYDANTTVTLWVKGIAVSADLMDECITLQALHNTTIEDTVKFTVIDVDKVEYCGLKKDQSVAGNWGTDTNIAAGAKNTDVHKAKVRITIAPAVANAPLTAARNGGSGAAIAGDLQPATAQATDSSGQIYCTYTSSDKIEDLTVKVTECDGSPVSIDLGSTLRQKWDIGDDCVGTAPPLFEVGIPDTVSLLPTLEVPGGVGAIDAHSVTCLVGYADIYWVEWDVALQSVLSGDMVDTVTYPGYVGVPFSQTMESLVVISPTTDAESPGTYTCTHTVYDYWDFDFDTWILKCIEVDYYGYFFADLSVVDP